jgi:hypothetical protein
LSHVQQIESTVDFQRVESIYSNVGA